MPTAKMNQGAFDEHQLNGSRFSDVDSVEEEDGWETLEQFQPTPYQDHHKLPSFSPATTRAKPIPSPAAADYIVDEYIITSKPRSPSTTITAASASFHTITHQGFISLLVLNDDEYEWEDRFAILQPNLGLFVFQDEEEAGNWRRSEDSYKNQHHLLLPNLARASGVECKKKSLDDRFALLLLDPSAAPGTVLCTMALETAAEREEWIRALYNATILAKFFQTLPPPELVRVALTATSLTSLSFDHSAFALFPSVCNLIEACGNHLERLELNACVQSLGALKLHAGLVELDISNNVWLGDAEFHAFFASAPPELPKLRTLIVANCGLGDVAFKSLAAFIKRQNGSSSAMAVGGGDKLDVGRNPQVSVLGAYELALAALPLMEEISFAACEALQDEFCQVLALLLVRRTKRLNLSRIGMTDRGLNMLLAELGRLSHCTVDFRGNDLLTLSACLAAVSARGTNTLLFSLLDDDANEKAEEELEAQKLLVLEEEEETARDSTSRVNCFAFGPLPSYERLFRFIRGELHGREIRLFASEAPHVFDLIIPGDFDGQCVHYLQTRLRENKNKYAVFRIESIVPKEEEGAAAAMDALSVVNAPIFFLPHAVASLEALASACYELFFNSQGGGNGVELCKYHFEVLLSRKSVLSPSLAEAVRESVLHRRLPVHVLAAACGMDGWFAAEDAAGEYDALSHLQLACNRGDVSQVHQVFATLSASSKSFCKRLARILSLRLPPVLLKTEEEEELSFVLLSEEMISAKLNELFSITDVDAFCTQASELLGRVSMDEDSLHDLHVLLLFRTCQEEDTASQLEWMFACVALRLCAPPAASALLQTLRDAYQRCFQETGNAMAQICSRTLQYHLTTHPAPARGLSVKQRLVFVRQCFTHTRSLPVTVYLADKSAIVVQVKAFSTFATLLALVNDKLGPAKTSSADRWRGFCFVAQTGSGGATDQILRFEDDPFWWAQREQGRGSGGGVKAKLHLTCLVPSFAPLQADFTDSIRIGLLFEQRRREFASSLVVTGEEENAQFTAYLLVLLGIERLGEDVFRHDTSSKSFARHLQSNFPGVDFANQEFASWVETYRVEFLTSAVALHNAMLLRSAFLCALRMHAAPGTRVFAGIAPHQICNGEAVMDATALHDLPLALHLDAWGVRVYFESNQTEPLVEIEFAAFDKVEQDEQWIKIMSCEADAEARWLYVEFPTREAATLLVDLIHLHLWALLAHGGLVCYDYEFPELIGEEDFAFRFAGFPKLPPPPPRAVPRQRHLASQVKRTRYHAQVLADQLFRAFNLLVLSPQSTGAGCYAPLETTAPLLEQEEDMIEPPLMLPPPPPAPPLLENDGDTEEDEEEDFAPQPPDFPPPPEEEEEEEEDFDLSAIAPPPGPPPPMLVEEEAIASANAPRSWLSANDLQQGAKPAAAAAQPPKGLSMMEEIKWKQAQKHLLEEPSTPSSSSPPSIKKLATGNVLLESMLAQRQGGGSSPTTTATTAAAAASSPESSAAAVVLATTTAASPAMEEDSAAKRKAEFLRKKREREAAEAQG